MFRIYCLKNFIIKYVVRILLKKFIYICLFLYKKNFVKNYIKQLIVVIFEDKIIGDIYFMDCIYSMYINIFYNQKKNKVINIKCLC